MPHERSRGYPTNYWYNSAALYLHVIVQVLLVWYHTPEDSSCRVVGNAIVRASSTPNLRRRDIATSSRQETQLVEQKIAPRHQLRAPAKNESRVKLPNGWKSRASSS